jgi:hypothetical protein
VVRGVDPGLGRRRRRDLWAIASVALWVAVAFLPLNPSDLDQFFWPSAQAALAGHPLMVYQPAGGAAYPNANGPLALIPLTAVGSVVRALGWMNALQLRRAVAFGVFSLFVLLMAREGVSAIERMRVKSLSLWPRLLAYGALTVAPPIWQSLAGYGHIEQPIEVWLILLAVRWLAENRPVRAGAAFGLAILARTASGLFWVPLALAAWRRKRRDVAGLTAAAIAVGLAGILPFYLADSGDVSHSLLGYRGGLAVGAGSIWSLARGTSFEGLAQHADLAFVAVAAVALNLWLARRAAGLGGRSVYAGLALTAASFALLAKTVWPYYFMEVYVFTTIWAAGQTGPTAGKARLLLPPIVVSGLGLLAEGGVTPGLSITLVRAEGVAMFVLLGGAMLWIAATGRQGTAEGVMAPGG